MSSLEDELKLEAEGARLRWVKDGCHSWSGCEKRSVGQEMFGSPVSCALEVEEEVISEESSVSVIWCRI